MAVVLAVLVVACRPVGNETAGISSDAAGACPGLAGERVRWIVPYSPGGGYDVYSRLLEPFYEEAIGAEIVVENRPGIGGRAGVRMIRDADPDGLTLGIVNGRAHMTIAVPFATAESLGLPSERMGAAVYIMSSGTSGAHIIVPGR